MKHFLMGAIGTLLFVVLGMVFEWWLVGHGDPCLQQQAGYQVVVQAQRGIIDNYTNRLDKKRAEVVELQNAYAAALSEKIGKIDDVMAIKVDTEVASITNLAARMAPVEVAAKEEAKQQGGRIDVPWLKQQIMNSAKLAGVRWK